MNLRRHGASLAAAAAFVALTLLAYAPCSLRPFTLSLSHRTASSKAVEMRRLGMYLDPAPGKPPAFLTLWAYPEGGEALPLAVPSLVAGHALCRVLPARAAFNLVFMLNLFLSAWAFHRLARKLRYPPAAAAAYAALVVFHPCVQSFVLRGQIENVMLWTAGFAYGAIVDLVEGRRRATAFVAAVALPCLAVFSSPYLALFLAAAWPFILAHAVERLDLPWRAPGVRRALAAGLVLLGLLPVLVRFYAPGSAGAANLLNLNPGTADVGIAAGIPAESVLDLFNPSEGLWQEKPYLGTVFLAAVAWAFATLLRRRRSSRTPGRAVCSRDSAILLAGTAVLAVLALGRSFGPPGFRIPLPAALLDHLVPGFENVVKLNRLLPFMAACGGLLVARAVASRPPRAVLAAAAAIVALVAAEGLVVSPPGIRTRPRNHLDAAIDLPATVRALPAFEEEDLPVLDLPPAAGPESRRRWGAYTYFQSEHGQRLVWFDQCPDDPPGLRGVLVRLFNDPAGPAADADAWTGALRQVREQGIGLVVLHTSPDEAARDAPLVARLDSEFTRIGADDRTVAWRVRPPAAP